MFKVVVFIPEEHKEKVKNAMFDAGAGKIGNYDCCSFETKGTGQFRPLEGSKPFIGKKQQIEKVVEYKVEMVATDLVIEEVIKAMRKAHPYEEPAFDVIALSKLTEKK